MRVICLADLHGHLPPLPKGDIVCIAGDICPDGTVDDQAEWLMKEFGPWVDFERKANGGKEFFATWGNHDWVGETKKVPGDLDVEFLVNRAVNYQGTRIAGFPWTTVSSRWAFHKPRVACEDSAREFYHELDCRILLNHTPPYGVGDLCPDGDRVGSYQLKKFLERGRAVLCVTGHIHEGRGTYQLSSGSLVAHSSILDGYYREYSNDIQVVEVV